MNVDYHSSKYTDELANGDGSIYNQETWTATWVQLLTTILQNVPAAQGKLLIDLVNEPDRSAQSCAAELTLQHLAPFVPFKTATSTTPGLFRYLWKKFSVVASQGSDFSRRPTGIAANHVSAYRTCFPRIIMYVTPPLAKMVLSAILSIGRRPMKSFQQQMDEMRLLN